MSLQHTVCLRMAKLEQSMTTGAVSRSSQPRHALYPRTIIVRPATPRNRCAGVSACCMCVALLHGWPWPATGHGLWLQLQPLGTPPLFVSPPLPPGARAFALTTGHPPGIPPARHCGQVAADAHAQVLVPSLAGPGPNPRARKGHGCCAEAYRANRRATNWTARIS